MGSKPQLIWGSGFEEEGRAVGLAKNVLVFNRFGLLGRFGLIFRLFRIGFCFF